MTQQWQLHISLFWKVIFKKHFIPLFPLLQKAQKCLEIQRCIGRTSIESSKTNVFHKTIQKRELRPIFSKADYL